MFEPEFADGKRKGNSSSVGYVFNITKKRNFSGLFFEEGEWGKSVLIILVIQMGFCRKEKNKREGAVSVCGLYVRHSVTGCITGGLIYNAIIR